MKFHLVGELAEILRLSESQIYSLINTGKLRCHRMTTGKQGGIHVSEEQLQRYLRDSTLQPAAESGHIR